MPRLTKTQRALEGGARWLATSAVIISPWLFGCSEPWAFLLVNCLVYIAVLFWLFSLLAAAEPAVRVPGLTAVLLALTAVVGLQAVFLSHDVVRVLNPYSAAVVEQTQAVFDKINIWQLTRDGQQHGGTVLTTLSLSPAGSRRSLYLLIAYVGLFLILVNTCRHWHQLLHLAAVIAAAGFAMALVALIHKFSGSQEILWFHVPRYGGAIFGPFTNRNHFAAHANMLFGLAFGLFLSSRHFRDVVLTGQWRERLAWLSTRRASEMALSGFAVMLLAGAVCVSLSRGGMLSLAAALGVFAVAIVVRRESVAKARSGIAAVALLVIGAAVWLGSDPMLERLGTLREVAAKPMDDFRTIVTRDTLGIFSTCPLFGIGFGSFRHVYSVFQTPSLKFRWLHAHNDWAQLLAEGGVIGTILFLAAIALWLWCVRREFASARQRVKLFVIGVLVGLGTIVVHSLVDYSLHKPANALLLACLSGMALAGVHMKHVYGDEAEADPHPMAKGSRVGARHWFMRVASLLAILGMTVLLVFQTRELRGELAFTRFLYFKKVSDGAGDALELKRAVLNGLQEADLSMAGGRNNPDALAEIADAMTVWETNVGLDRGLRVTAAEKAARSAALAVTGAPSDYLTWLALARSETSMAMWDEAETCLLRARELVRHRDEVRMFDVLEMGEEILIP